MTMKLIVPWVVVAIPLIWGVVQTLINVAKLFQ